MRRSAVRIRTLAIIRMPFQVTRKKCLRIRLILFTFGMCLPNSSKCVTGFPRAIHSKTCYKYRIGTCPRSGNLIGRNHNSTEFMRIYDATSFCLFEIRKGEKIFGAKLLSVRAAISGDYLAVIGYDDLLAIKFLRVQVQVFF